MATTRQLRNRANSACVHRRISLTIALLLLAGVSAPRLDAQAAPIANIGLTAGWATFGEAVPPGIASAGLQVGTLQTQTDVKNRWADGSIKFAIVTVHAPGNASYAITASAASSGSFTPAVPAASVAFRMGSVTYTAALPNAQAADHWLSGPLVVESRTTVAPVSSADGAAHPFLRVNFDTRLYNDGKARVDVSVENMLDTVGATTITYDVAVTVDGQTVFSKTSVPHYYLTRWRKVFEVGPAPLAAVTPDIAPFNASRALPPYLSFVTDIVSTPTGPSYEILNSGTLATDMPAHGGRAELAPYPDWTARYLVHKNATQRSFVLANGDLSGSWPVHVREAETSATTGVGAERLVSLDQRPTIWYDERAQSTGYDYIKGTPLPMREYGSGIPGPGQTLLTPDNAHQPSIAYVPYLLTGDRYYAEEMAFWANYGMLRTYNGDGVRSALGILENNEVRGVGWALRNLAEAAAYYPDASPVKAYLSQKVANNLQWLDSYANSQNAATNPFRILWLNERPDGAQYIGLWEQNYLAYAIDRASKLGFAGGLAHRDAIARFQLRLFSSDPDYPRAQAAPYVVAVGTPGAGGAFTFFQGMAQIWSGTQGNVRPFAGYYGPEARLNLMMGVESGWPGAQAAYDYLWPFIGVSNTYCPSGGPDIPDLSCRAGWALDFYAAGGSTPPPPAVLTISGAAAAAITATSATIGWTTNAAASSRVDYGLSSSYGASAVDPALVTTHTVPVSGLSPSTTYHVKASSEDTSSTAAAGDFTFSTRSQLSAQISAPANGSTISGTVVISAAATGTSGVAGVTFMVDGTALGAEVTAAPYTRSFDTATVSSGTHTLSAVARDSTGNSATSAGVTVSVSGTPPVPPAAGVVVDKVIFADGSGTRTTPIFSTVGDVIVAFAASDGPKSTHQTVKVSGAGLIWTLVRRANGQAGTAEIWTAKAPAGLSNARVTSTQSSRGYHQSLTVVAFTGARGVGASSAAGASSGAPAVSVTTTVNGAVVFGIGDDWDRAVARTIGSGQAIDHQWIDTATNDTYWVQQETGAVPAAGTVVRLNDTGPTSDRWNFAGVEIAPR